MTLSTQTKIPDAFQDSRLLSRNQVCDMLGVSIVTLHKLINSRKDPIPTVKIGHMRRFKLDQVIWWIEKHQQ